MRWTKAQEEEIMMQYLVDGKFEVKTKKLAEDTQWPHLSDPRLSFQTSVSAGVQSKNTNHPRCLSQEVV